MSDDQFTKLFKYVEQRFNEVEARFDTRFDSLDSRMDSIFGAMDTVTKDQETEETERLAMSHQLDRHERWIQQLARGADTELAIEG
ncbi:hypothetical protein [Pseudofrankia sp. DC12]|uniref:hypothetical protein n=1 Tax=Pseudofrankia sp. DC12 TaxID=683315 RepID=UPI0005F7CEF5|nr:hypothetical protein [Pseudofrankia sp. DC12]